MFRVSIPEDLDLTFELVASCLTAAGLSITNPGNGRITSWSSEGEQFVIDTEKLMFEIKSGAVRNIQFWLSASNDMFVSWEIENSLAVFSFYIDGVDDACSVTVAAKLVELVLNKYKNGRLTGDVFALAFE
ncbi:hypothetical protein C0Z17_29280 [Trinickia caryophylli]|nr:hypothetical protein C0Z17_29280 [Trinickia caryophylli]